MPFLCPFVFRSATGFLWLKLYFSLHYAGVLAQVYWSHQIGINLKNVTIKFLFCILFTVTILMTLLQRMTGLYK